MTLSIANKFIVFNQPDITEEEISAVGEVLRSGWIGTGKVSRQFEEEFADFMGGGYAVAVSSCTMGLQLALKTCNLELVRNDFVILPPLTFAATLNAVLSVFAIPIFVDVDENGLLDVEDVNLKLSNLDIKAVIPVHYSGSVFNVSKLKLKGQKVIEDCAHAFGALFPKKSDFKVFSFYANKNITCGEGGMVLCKSKEMSNEIRIMASQGLSLDAWNRYGSGPIKKYSVERVGLKGNMPDILAAIGLTQLRRWPELRDKKRTIFKIYEEAFGKKEIGHSMHFYPIRLKNRDEVRLKLHENGIGTGVHYKPLHLEPAYKFLGNIVGEYPMAEAWGREELSLPVSTHMKESDANRIVEIINEFRTT